jgi:hypothetical protein
MRLWTSCASGDCCNSSSSSILSNRGLCIVRNESNVDPECHGRHHHHHRACARAGLRVRHAQAVAKEPVQTGHDVRMAKDAAGTARSIGRKRANVLMANEAARRSQSPKGDAAWLL